MVAIVTENSNFILKLVQFAGVVINNLDCNLFFFAVNTTVYLEEKKDVVRGQKFSQTNTMVEC